MRRLGLNQIREEYLKFFESKEHLRMESASLVPVNDNSLLLINSGMAPLKPYFTGAQTPPSKRVTTCQKCIRTPDIERVGKTARHGTFFEMLGNFSFGDYFKKEATLWAWEFVTEKMQMPVDKLFVSIYEEDDEAFDIWTQVVGVAPERIVWLGKADNFWEHGTGPCGPCSEIYFDRGVERGCGSPDCAVGCDCDRFIEFWNLVFTQFDKDSEGNYTRLASPNIDTGMGLERIAAIMQGVESLFDVDTVRNIMAEVSLISGIKYNVDKKTDVSLRVITDHIRSTVFMTCDGVLPSNEGRGYVLRRLLRRAARHGKLLGINELFLSRVANVVIQESGEAYPQLQDNKDYINKIIALEEQRFNETIDQGLSILNQYIEEIGETKKLSGEKTFKLYDTYGFPLDLTLEILEEHGLEADIEGFETEMTLQRERARAARVDQSSWEDDNKNEFLKSLPKTVFLGYDKESCVANILEIRQDSDVVEIVLDKTPFYAEHGGQVGDTGIISTATGRLIVKNTVTHDDITMHQGELEGIMKKGTQVTASIDIERRNAVQRNHSATHLLQKALQNTLGTHVVQRGSLVASDRLRFDFTHFSAMTSGEIQQVENEVNKRILEGLVIGTKEMPVAEARKLGAMALFGEKYGDMVRVVSMGEYSTELCGGCHLSNTANVGIFKIISESGVAAGVRRIEAITSIAVLKYIRKVQTDNACEVERLRDEMKEVIRESNRKIESLTAKQVGGKINELINSAEKINGIDVVTGQLDNIDASALRNACDEIKANLPTSVAILASVKDDKISFVAMASESAIELGAHAGKIVSSIAKITGGNGGGKPNIAQAGGIDVTKLEEALKEVKNIVKEII